MRILDFSDGFESSQEPSSSGFSASDVEVTPLGNLAATDAQAAVEELQADIDAINNKVGAVNGIATLGSDGKLTTGQIPLVSLVDVSVVADIATRDALTVQEGDVAVVTNAGSGVSKTYIYNGSSWTELVTDGSLAAHMTDSTDAHAASAITNTPSGNLAATTVQAALNELQTDVDGRIANTLTTTQGDMIYASAANTPARLAIGSAGQVLKSVGGVPTWATFSGGINYLSSNPDAEADTAGWTTFADGASATPVDGTGGSPNSTWTRSTSSPLRGSASFLWTKSSGASRQGEGVSYAFTIDAADQGQVLQISFDYLVASGTFADNDMQVWVYDVTNAVMIQPAPTNILNTSVAQRWQGTFQTATNSTSYRLILYVPVTTNSANTVRFDNFEVGPQKKSYGPFISDWVSYTPTGSWVSNTTYTGRWRRVGDSAEIQYDLAIAGAPTSADLTLNLPSGLAIDTAKLASTTFPGVGYGSIFDSGTRTYEVIPTLNGTTVYLIHTESGNTGLVNATNPITFAANDRVSVTLRLPITGWSSGQLLSSDADTRVVAAYGYRSAAATLAPNASYVKLSFDASSFDTHGALDKTTNYRYDCVVPGYYFVDSTISISSANLLNNLYVAAVFKNGSKAVSGASQYPQAGGVLNAKASGLVYCNAGDYLDVRLFGAGNNSVNTLAVATGADGSFFSVQRISGPSQIAASESVTARVYFSSTQTGVNTNNTFVKLTPNAVSFDSHSSYSTGTNRYTAPVSGRFRVTGTFTIAGTNVLAADYQLAIYKNGVVYSAGPALVAAASNTTGVVINDLVNLLAGDYIEFYLYGAGNNSVSTLTINSGSANSFATIERVGNY